MTKTPEHPLKLVHVTTVPLTLRFFRGQVGYLKERGFQVHAVTSPGDLLQEFHQQENIPVHAVPMVRPINLFSDLAALLRLWRLFRLLKPDIVHSHTPKAALLGTLAARMAGVRVIMVSLHGLPQVTRKGPLRFLLDFTTRLSCSLADRAWCVSFSLRDHLLQQRLCPASKLVVLGQGSINGVDARTLFSPSSCPPAVRKALRSRYNIPEDALLPGYVGRIVKEKGMGELAAAWRILRDSYPGMHLLLVGPFEPEDPLLPEDELLFRQDERIHLAGMQSDIPAHLGAMDLFLLPSYREGFNVAILEAAAMELPIIATRIPGCTDFMEDGINGRLVPPRDSAALAAAIKDYVDNPALRRQHGAAGRQKVLRDFRPQAIWEALYQEYLTLWSVKARL